MPPRAEIDTGNAEPAVGDLRRDYFVASRGECGGNGSVTATRLPDGTTEANVSENASVTQWPPYTAAFSSFAGQKATWCPLAMFGDADRSTIYSAVSAIAATAYEGSDHLIRSCAHHR